MPTYAEETTVVSRKPKEGRNSCVRDFLDSYFAEARMYAVLTKVEERSLFERYFGNGDPNARELLVLHNLQLVISIARTFCGKGLDLPDLIQEGNIGLLNAIERFDLSRNLKFSTYATIIIRQQIYLALSKKGRMIRVPRYTNLRLRRLNDMVRTFSAQHGRRPTIEEMAQSENVSVKKVRELLAGQRAAALCCLEQPLVPQSGSTEEACIGDMVCSPLASSFVCVPELREELLRAERDLGHIRVMLDSRFLSTEVDIFMRLHGLSDADFDMHPMEQVAQVYDLTESEILSIDKKVGRWLSAQPGPTSTRDLSRLRNRLMALSELIEVMGV